jgi:hypothetical protein
MLPTEEQEQVAVARWLRRNRVLFTHPPNGMHRTKSAGARLKRLGVIAGVPDLLIFSPAPAFPEARGVAIEMKRRSRGMVSLNQERFHRALEEAGWLVYVCEGAAVAINQLKELGYGLGIKEGQNTPPETSELLHMETTK